MRVRIDADIPSNHVLNDFWMLQHELKKLGLTDIRVQEMHECSNDASGRSCMQCINCVGSVDVMNRNTTYYCIERRSNRQTIPQPDATCCEFFSLKPNIDKEESPVGPMHKIGDRWIPD